MGIKERKRYRKIKEHVISRDGLRCCYCDAELTFDTATLDHIVPDSKRGTYNTTNLTVACAPCNNKRGSRSFFEYCKYFNFSPEKIEKYKKLYLSNLKIKILNIAKEEMLIEEYAVPVILITQACQVLHIQGVDFSLYETNYNLEIRFGELYQRKKIKYWFEQLIKIIEADNV